MKPLRVLVSLMTEDNDYQLEQAAAARETAKRLGIEVEIVFAENDSITQSQQLLKAVQAAPQNRPEAIALEPVSSTALPQVARAAVSAGIAWAVINRAAPYISDLRLNYRVPILNISKDHKEIGRIQGRQIAALLPKGGAILYITGTSESSAAQQRIAGMNETKPENAQITFLKGQWTEASAHRVVTSWLRLTTSQKARVDLVAGQNDVMALGARRAFEQQQTSEIDRKRWLSVPYLGIDGVPRTGQAWVRSGLLTATVVSPPNAQEALEMLHQALRQGIQRPQVAPAPSTSFPTIEVLAASRGATATSPVLQRA
ncbi:MAG: sugar ABC transporter substrate-binding protein [Candidatus Acidiferrales bacterium]